MAIFPFNERPLWLYIFSRKRVVPFNKYATPLNNYIPPFFFCCLTLCVGCRQLTLLMDCFTFNVYAMEKIITKMVQSLRLLLLPLLAVAANGAFAQNWQLVWQDEFTNGISPDWVFETGTGSDGWGNQELQYYRRENATVENGQLVITARRE